MERVRLFLEASGAADDARQARRGAAAGRLAMARVFVTGASGFIGGALAERLRERGDEVVGLARSDVAEAIVAGRGAEVARGRRARRGEPRRRHGGLLARLSRRRGQHPLPARPGDAACASTSAAPRPPCGRRRRPACRGWCCTSSAASVGEAEGTVGTRGRPTHRGSYLSGLRPLQAPGRADRVRGGASGSGVELVAVNPSSVQGPGRSSGNGKIIISLPQRPAARVRRHLHQRGRHRRHRRGSPAGRRARGRAGRRYVLNGATIHSAEALRIVSGLSGVTDPVRIVPPALARAAAALAEGAAGVRGRTSSVCRARVRTILHGHRYDGSLADARAGPAATRRSRRPSGGRSSGRWPKASSRGRCDRNPAMPTPLRTTVIGSYPFPGRLEFAAAHLTSSARPTSPRPRRRGRRRPARPATEGVRRVRETL